MTLDGLSALSPPHAPGERLLFARCAERKVRKTGSAPRQCAERQEKWPSRKKVLASKIGICYLMVIPFTGV